MAWKIYARNVLEKSDSAWQSVIRDGEGNSTVYLHVTFLCKNQMGFYAFQFGKFHKTIANNGQLF